MAASENGIRTFALRDTLVRWMIAVDVILNIVLIGLLLW